MTDYPREVSYTVTRWECGWSKPGGTPCRHLTFERAAECAADHATREKMLAERDRLLASVNAGLARDEARHIVADLLDGQSVSAVAEAHGKTPAKVRSLLYYCLSRAMADYTRTRAEAGADRAELQSLRRFRLVSAILTHARQNRAVVSNALNAWWPTAKLPMELW